MSPTVVIETKNINEKKKKHNVICAMYTLTYWGNDILKVYFDSYNMAASEKIVCI